MRAFISKYLLKALIALAALYVLGFIWLGIGVKFNLSDNIGSTPLLIALALHVLMWFFSILCLMLGLIEGRRIYIWTATFVLTSILLFGVGLFILGNSC